MFRGCIMDVLFTETNLNTVKLLSKAGFDVVLSSTQKCCGALHAHSGELEQAKSLARSNIQAFQDAKVDYIVSNAGGCGALLVEYGHLLHDDPQYAEAGKQFAEKVKDVSQIIMEKGYIPQFAATLEEASQDTQVTITYQDSCHLRNVMKAGNAPRDLMDRVAGIRFVEMEGADRCCGSAGIYNLVQPDMSMQILDHKMEHVQETNARYLLTSNPGCLLQMKLGIEREHLNDKVKAVHIIDFLYERIVDKMDSE
jgi:glycolate oxidase iron-sulfur subunit